MHRRPRSKAYLTHIAKKYGVFDKIRFNCEVTKAVWDEDTRHWQLEYRNEHGGSSPLTVRIVISASGLFSTPRLPDIPGIERFRGSIFHTTAWDHDVDLAGKRAALIGNGSTGTQLMPHVAPICEITHRLSTHAPMGHAGSKIIAPRYRPKSAGCSTMSRIIGIGTASPASSRPSRSSTFSITMQIG